MSGRNAATAPNVPGERPRDRAALRGAILEAARRLIEQNGEKALTLKAVADAVHIARATFYSYFASRQDLLSQVAAASQPAGATDGKEPAPAGGAPGEEYRDLMQAQADALKQIAGHVIVPKSLMKQGTEAVLTRVETRLGVAEKAAAALERRLAERTQELSGQISAVDESLRQLKEYMNAFERRQLAAVAELRLDLHNMIQPERNSSRIEPAAPAEIPFVPETPREASVPRSEPAAAENYLSTARRAAITAQQATFAEPPQRTSWLARLGSWGRRRIWQLLMLAALAAALLNVFALTDDSHVDATLKSAAVRSAAKPARALDLAARAARGDAAAQLVLGAKLLNGTGVRMDVDKAVPWLERAAAAGQPVAQNYLGVLYQTGTGVPADIVKAIGWYRAAAEYGNVKAMANLGKIYAGGWSEGTDYEKAAQWFGRAAALGDIDAQFDLAILFELGQGVSRSVAQAYKWYMIAASAGDEKAHERAGLLAARLSPGEMQAAQTAAAAFKVGKPNPAANDVPSLAR